MNTTKQELLNIAAELANLSQSEVLELLHASAWDTRNGLQWEMYVPSGVRSVWQRLTDEARLVAYIQASDRIIEGILRAD
jgi:hypothetical protein